MSTISRVAPAVTALQDTPAAGGSYEVQRGDSLPRIAADHGVTLDALLAANPQVRNPDVIYPGSRLQLPQGAGLMHVGESVYLPEPLSNTVADLLPGPTHGLLHDIPLLALYRFDPTWRRDTYQAAVRLQSIITTAEAPRQDSDAPEGMPLLDPRNERAIDRKERMWGKASPQGHGAPDGEAAPRAGD